MQSKQQAVKHLAEHDELLYDDEMMAANANPHSEICYVIRRAHQRGAVIFQEIMKEYDLTPTQYAVLAKIAELGEISQNHLGRLVAMDHATNQGVVRRLLKRGFLCQRHDPNDKRRLLLSLNNTHRDVLDRILADGTKISPVVLSPLTPEERYTLLELLRKIG